MLLLLFFYGGLKKLSQSYHQIALLTKSFGEQIAKNQRTYYDDTRSLDCSDQRVCQKFWKPFKFSHVILFKIKFLFQTFLNGTCKLITEFRHSINFVNDAHTQIYSPYLPYVRGRMDALEQSEQDAASDQGLHCLKVIPQFRTNQQVWKLTYLFSRSLVRW